MEKKQKILEDNKKREEMKQLMAESLLLTKMSKAYLRKKNEDKYKIEKA